MKFSLRDFSFLFVAFFPQIMEAPPTRSSEPNKLHEMLLGFPANDTARGNHRHRARSGGARVTAGAAAPAAAAAADDDTTGPDEEGAATEAAAAAAAAAAAPADGSGGPEDRRPEGARTKHELRVAHGTPRVVGAAAHHPW
jgi:hypothetical protein